MPQRVTDRTCMARTCWLGWVRKPKGLETRPDSDSGALSSVQADKTPLLPFQRAGGALGARKNPKTHLLGCLTP